MTLPRAEFQPEGLHPRPWVAVANDEPLRDRRGGVRRFATEEAAFNAALDALDGPKISPITGAPIQVGDRITRNNGPDLEVVAVSRGGRPKRSRPRASIALRLEPALLERIDDFAFMREAPRNAAIVALIETGLATLAKAGAA